MPDLRGRRLLRRQPDRLLLALQHHLPPKMLRNSKCALRSLAVQPVPIVWSAGKVSALSVLYAEGGMPEEVECADRLPASSPYQPWLRGWVNRPRPRPNPSHPLIHKIARLLIQQSFTLHPPIAHSLAKTNPCLGSPNLRILGSRDFRRREGGDPRRAEYRGGSICSALFALWAGELWDHVDLLP
jgi:hypothetical protein